MSRAQKYHVRKRYIYGLLFRAEGKAYIGQTVDLKRRRKEHEKAWQEPFDFIRLGSLQGTQAVGEDHEYAWRWAAGKAGWTVIAKAWDRPAFRVNPRSRMNGERWSIAGDCRWPMEHRRFAKWWWLKTWAAWQGAAIAGCWLVLSVGIRSL